MNITPGNFNNCFCIILVSNDILLSKCNKAEAFLKVLYLFFPLFNVQEHKMRSKVKKTQYS